MANEWKDIGRDIKDAVVDAVNSGDFSQLNSRITGSVGAAIDEVNARLSGNGHSQGNWATPGTGPSSYHVRQPVKKTPPPPNPGRKEPTLFARYPKGSVSGILCAVLGGVFLGLSGIAILVLTVLLLTGVLKNFVYWTPTGILIPVFLASAVLLVVGIYQSGRLGRFRRYVQALRGKTYCSIGELAQKSGKKAAYVVRDLQKMIAMGMFTQAHLDDEKKTLLLTDDLYQQYQELKRQRQQQAAKGAESADERLYRETVEKGQHYLEVIRRANDAISGEIVSAKLYRLEDIVRQIFEQVKTCPQQIPELRRFMDYYMPTTLKLVETYRQMDAQQVAGANIQKAKEEIEKTLDTINLAFENLFDSLFAHTAVDISSDISVLKTLLKQEGLTEKDFTS